MTRVTPAEINRRAAEYLALHRAELFDEAREHAQRRHAGNGFRPSMIETTLSDSGGNSQ
ncbi:MAG: hypothetical protein WA728_34405 [Xanthobacteraceae bacterium]